MNIKEILTDSFKEALLWSSTDENDDPLDKYYGFEDFAPETNQTIDILIDRFMADCLHLVVDEPGYTFEQAGRDLWFTIAGHGCGFWEQPLNGDLLTQWTKSYRHLGETYINDNYQICLSGDLKK
jgi:hypothetical protein